MAKKKVKGAKYIMAQGEKLGDKAAKIFDESDDVKVLQQSIAAYSLATKTALAQIQYKKLTGTPSKMEFFED